MTVETSHPQHNITSPGNLVQHECGLEVVRSVDGETAQAVIDSLVDISLTLAHHIAALSFGGVYSRPGLDPRSHQFVMIGVLMALDGCEPQLRIHIGTALNVGLTREEIVEAVPHASVYAGLSRALNATFVARKVFAERDVTD